VDWFVADMSSQAEVRALAAEVPDRYRNLDVLINNVGGFWANRHTTADGLEHTFAVNHLASFLLTNLLLERLQSSAPARIVTVSSGAQAMGSIDFDDLQGERGYRASERTTSPSWPTSCSLTSSRAAWPAPASLPPCFTQASFALASAPRTRGACSAC
jgi:NAD(P)-dependent dehydrogenase (short-subunit alcohol dehydrogenase family)